MDVGMQTVTERMAVLLAQPGRTCTILPHGVLKVVCDDVAAGVEFLRHYRVASAIVRREVTVVPASLTEYRILIHEAL